MPSIRIDPPYPSLTLVLTRPAPSFPPTPTPPSPPAHTSRSSDSRLPAYRMAHMGRYHPYPRVVAPAPAKERHEDRLMSTVDYRYVDEPLWEEAEPTCVESENDTARDENIEDTGVTRESASYDTASTYSTGHDPDDERARKSKSEKLGRKKFALAFSNTVVALRRRYLSLQAARSFLLKTEHVKQA
ncbi:hypothetical protein C8Q70DRAFT_11980 [Cubamyces menziesii]|uniref:Uncharacterized protein n=1 Tax=Trametes cubensis TaxID=1111947 RepID=A0AAD7U428_9APHY|nr:hypothetical protein C8Q70DRAFT_11980 [Cubamyces menziesii]KAJ8496176.1 hypothetical protein ONZ51_g1302 [Trametes cubensis]